MACDPLFWVLVRNYRLLKTNSLVQSPHVDLDVYQPPIIIREINGEYMEEPRVINDTALLGDDNTRRNYRHAAHGVFISREYADDFPIWVCLERNMDCKDNHLAVLNLFTFKFLVVPISSICWVPSHEARNGELYTIIGGPGIHGYKEIRLPMIVQKLGLPWQAKFAVPLSSLPLAKLEQDRQHALFDQQYERFKLPYGFRSLMKTDIYGIRQRSSHPQFYHPDHILKIQESTRHFYHNSINELQRQGFCRCSCRYVGLKPAYVDRNPLHKYITDAQYSLGPSHQIHCLFAAHRQVRCVVGSSIAHHGHDYIADESHLMTIDPILANIERPTSSANTSESETYMAVVETEDEANDDAEFIALPCELEILAGQPCFRDSDKVHEDIERQMWSIHNIPVLSSMESRPVTPGVEICPDMLVEPERSDSVPEIIDIITIRRNFRAIVTTPEPPEMPP
ncbi:hypothetical protein RRF57_011487 [Xylaria bambusicola]|uniref:Uncharacterized protein n=1 Tax=Xylaria bambusicola TaxID=326684 RepID=A0AAN7UMX3_9PEZI